MSPVHALQTYRRRRGTSPVHQTDVTGRLRAPLSLAQRKEPTETTEEEAVWRHWRRNKSRVPAGNRTTFRQLSVPQLSYYTNGTMSHQNYVALEFYAVGNQVLIMKANQMHYFSDLFDKVLYMFRTCPLSIIRSISTLYTRNRYSSFQFCWRLLAWS